jgi:hypothetical protein
MQVYLGLKPKRKTESASAASSGSAAAAPPAPEDSVGRAIDLLNAEFFSTGTQLKHVFTSAQVVPPPPPLKRGQSPAAAAPNTSLPQVYSIVSDRSAVDRELQCMVSDGSLSRGSGF